MTISEVRFKDEPHGDPNGVELHKKSTKSDDDLKADKENQEGNINYGQAKFTVWYYPNMDGRNSHNSDDNNAIKKWVFKTENPTSNVIDFGEQACLEEGKFWEFNSGRRKRKIWLMGTYRMKETTVPEGCEPNNTEYFATVNKDGKWVWDAKAKDLTGNGKLIVKNGVTDNSKVYVNQQAKVTGLSLKKYARATGTNVPIPGTSFDGIQFRLYNVSTHPVKFTNLQTT